jgi:hypothetical protein
MYRIPYYSASPQIQLTRELILNNYFNYHNSIHRPVYYLKDNILDIDSIPIFRKDLLSWAQ